MSYLQEEKGYNEEEDDDYTPGIMLNTINNRNTFRSNCCSRIL